MIVMKFGGSSVESANAIARVASIVRSHLQDQPVVVVSAMGKTTDRLLEIAKQAARHDEQLLGRQLEDLEDFHFLAAEKLLNDNVVQTLEKSLQETFSQLRLTLTKVGRSDCGVTPALKDEIASYGERLSSQVVAAAFSSAGIRARHLDARGLIVTNGEHTRATPQFAETYSRIRRAVLPADGTVVMGGFIAATEQGITTTLGRGGSDLTASIVGAAIGAAEIQIWTDVDGMLTCDPRVLVSGCRLRSISYAEAAEMARWGAKVLHPDTVMPAIEKQIPIVIRNSRRPQAGGTRIVAQPTRCTNAVKSIASKADIMLLEIRSSAAVASPAFLQALANPGTQQRISAELVWRTGETLYVGIKNGDRYLDLRLDLDGCVEVHLRNERAVISLVGEGVATTPGLIDRAAAVLNRIDAQVLRPECSPHTISIVVPQRELARAVELLHREFFQHLDPSVFAEIGQSDPVHGQQSSAPKSQTLETCLNS